MLCKRDIFRKFFVPFFLEVNFFIGTFIILRAPVRSDLVYPFYVNFDDVLSLYV